MKVRVATLSEEVGCFDLAFDSEIRLLSDLVAVESPSISLWFASSDGSLLTRHMTIF